VSLFGAMQLVVALVAALARVVFAAAPLVVVPVVVPLV
jgi:hypothetical protein